MSRSALQRVVKGGAAYARNRDLSPSVGDAWRSLYDLHARGGLRAWYDAQVPDGPARRRGIDEGRFILDRRLAHFFTARARREPPFFDASAPRSSVVDHAVRPAGGERRARPHTSSVTRAPRRWLGRIRRMGAKG